MIKVNEIPYYAPMKQTDKYCNMTKKYLKQMDDAYGTEYSIRDWKQTIKEGDKNERR